MSSTVFGSVEIDFLGHASVKLKDSNGFTVYIDPWSEVVEDTNDKADVIVSTHDHFDHFDPEIIEELSTEDTLLLCTEESEKNVPSNTEYEIIDSGDHISAGKTSFRGVPAYNVDKFRKPDTPYHPKGFCVGVIFEMDDFKFYHASDTDLIDELSDLENIDLMFAPIGGKYTMDQNEAADAVKRVDPEHVVPIHYNVVDGTEADSEEFKEKVESETDSRVIVL